MARKNPALYRPKSAADLLSLPGIGRLLKWRWGRLALQLPLAIITLLIIYDGFTGPQSASRNLATVTPWVHYRGLVVLVLLLVGNLFCMACPFTLPRTLAKKLSIRGRRFPRLLRNKWLAIFGLFALFFIYEWLDLWASPALTAWVIVAYFVASFVLEAFFTESAFCKYICPLGTFNFVYSSASPTQIAVKDHAVCQHCAGKECVNGSYAPQSSIVRVDEIPYIDADGVLHMKKVNVQHSPKGTLGCGTQLYPPQITSNMDCVFCLDCVRACPHDNIGLMTRLPGRELLKRGAWPKRWDVSLLVIALAFMGVTNAFGMVPPVFALQDWLVRSLGVNSEFVALLLIFGIGNLLLPVVAALSAGFLAQMFTRTRGKISLRDTVATFAPAIIPLSFGIWIAHYGFHFLIAPLAIIPIVQEFLGQTGQWAIFAQPADEQLISVIQVLALMGGFLWSMMLANRAAMRVYRRQAPFALAPFALLFLLLMLAAVAIFSLPMEMRGTDDIYAALLQMVA